MLKSVRWLDFNTLVPRGTYILTVQSAMGSDGIQIAKNSATAFTVDYAGYINDTTPPPAPTVAACAAATPDTLSAHWSASDPESTIDRYQYAIGLTPGGAEVVNWTFTTLTEATRTGLTLIAGQTYYVSVKARNEGGLWSVAGSVGVVAGSGGCSTNEPAPVASFEANPRSGPAPLTVVFTDTSTGTITAWEWAFGDGVTSTLHNPTHTYTTPGAYTVTLTVTGPGGSDTEMKANYITVTYPPPQADFTATPRSGDAPLEVHFTSVVTGVVTSYAWDFGDGGTATVAHPTHIYTRAGSFGVSLAVTGPGGTAQVVKPGYITVSPPPSAPTATFSANVVSGTAPLTVTFTAVTSGTVEYWHWTFGDGAEAFTGPVVQHTYVTSGVFNVSLTVSNTYGSYTVNKPRYITVNPPPGTAYQVYLPLVLRNR